MNRHIIGKKEIIFIFASFCSALLTVFSVCIAPNATLVNNAETGHDSNCSWSHYSMMDPTTEYAASKEYWACCKHKGSYVYSLNDVTSSHIDEIGDLSPTTRSQIDSDDERYYSPKLTEGLSLLFDTKSSNWVASHVNPTGYSGGAITSSNCNDDSFLDSYTKLSNINQSYEWIWYEPNSTNDVSSYEEIIFWVNSSQNLDLGIVNNYTQRTVYSLTANVWTKICVKPSDVSVTTMQDLGFGVWGKISNLTLKFSSVYGSKKTILYNAKTDYWVGYTPSYGGGFEYSLNNRDKYVSPYSENKGINTSKDFLWLKPNSDIDITSYSKISFWVCSNQDRNVGLINNYSVVISYPLIANHWRFIELDVKTLKSSYGITKLSDIGFGDWGVHSDFTLKFSSIYAYSSIDDVLTGSKSFDIVAYSIPYIHNDTSRADTVFEYLKEANFTSGFGLLDGRNGDTAIQQILANYIDNPSEENLTALKTQISSNVSNNVLEYRNAIRAGTNNSVKYEALMGSLYDLNLWFKNESSPLYGKSLTDEQYLMYVREFLYDLAYYDVDEEDYYDGLAVYDEPSYDDVALMNRLKTYVKVYLDEVGLKGTPYINLLPAQSSSSKYLPYGSVYSAYIDNYMNILFPELKYISFDIYPRKSGNIVSYHLSNLEKLATSIKNAGGGKLMSYLHAANTSYDTSNDATRNVNDLLFEMYSAMAFGTTTFKYFQFSSNSDTKDSVGNCLVNKVTLEKTPVFEYAKQANAEIAVIGQSFCNFSWDGVMCNRSCTQFDALKSKLSSHGEVKSIYSSSSSSPLLVGCFHKNDFNAYLMMNYKCLETPISADMTINFNSKFNKIAVFKDGELTIQKLNASSFTTSLESSKAAFVIPFN